MVFPFPVVRHVFVIGALLAAFSIVILDLPLLAAPASAQHLTQEPPGARGCRTRVRGEPLSIAVGSTIRGEKDWLSCRLYEGHPVIIHSTDAPAGEPVSIDGA